MNSTVLGARMRLLTLGLGLATSLAAATLIFGAESSHAQTADFDADGYADEVEEELGSHQNDPDSTPEHFALLWSCTDGNDNDKDGGRDFRDDGCKNAVPGSPTPGSPTPTPAPSGGGSTGSGSSGSGDGNAVFGGSNAPGGGGSNSGDASDTGAGDGSGDGMTTDATSTDAGGDTGAGDENAASDDSGSGDGSGFPWKLSLLILAVGLVLAALIYALTSARSRRMSAR